MSTNEQIIPWFRSLFEAIDRGRYGQSEADLRPEQMIEQWCIDWGNVAVSWFRALSERSGDPVPSVSQEELWGLYAFSRVNQLLLLAFQEPGSSDSDWAQDVTPDEYRSFLWRFGLDAVTAKPFSPFFHEIVAVEQTPDDDAAPVILRELWPAVMLGNLLISRAGVAVSAGKSHVNKDIAERSTLYFEYCRRNRKVSDLSHGWGHNSQWRTDFRRDYLFDGYFHFNVDGEALTSELHPYDAHWIEAGLETEAKLVPLSHDERIELLMYRSLVTIEVPDQDHWPFDDTICAPTPIGLVVTRDNGDRVWSTSIEPKADVPPPERPTLLPTQKDPVEPDDEVPLYRWRDFALRNTGGFLASLRALWNAVLRDRQ